MGRGWGSFEVFAIAQIAIVGRNMDVKGGQGDSSERRAGEKVSVISETYVCHLTQMLVEMQTSKALLVRSQKEKRNSELETTGKMFLILKWQRTWLNCVLLLCGRQNLQGMILAIQLRKLLSPVFIEHEASFLLTAQSEI